VPRGDEQVGFAGSGVPDQARGVALVDPVAFGELVHGRGVDGVVGVEVEVAEPLVPGESGCLDPADRGAAVPVVDLGEEELGKEPLVGQLLLVCHGEGFVDEGPDGG
jgi:hypothetical protein